MHNSKKNCNFANDLYNGILCIVQGMGALRRREGEENAIIIMFYGNEKI